MNRNECAQLDLIDALHDGRLGPQEAASCARHVQSCAVCAARQQHLVAIREALRTPGPAPMPLDHQRARLALLRAAAAGTMDDRRQARPALPLRWVMAGGMLFAATAMAGVAVWRSSQAPTPAPTPIAAAAELLAPVANPPAPTPAPLAKPATATASTPPELPPLAEPAPAPHAAPHGKRPPATQAAAPAATVAEAEPPSDEAPAPRTPASRDFAAAMAALEAGDFALAAGRFRAFAAAYPQDARADEAAYLVAIALDRAGRASSARSAAQRYLRDFARGAHRAQAAKLVQTLAPAAGSADEPE